MTLTIRRATDEEADLEAIAGVVNQVAPDSPTSVGEMRWSDRTYPGTARFLAEHAGRPIGAATAGRIYMYPPDFPAFWGSVDVLPGERRRGIGSALLRAIAGHTRDAGKSAMHISASEARPEGIAFLRRHGFVEYDRSKTLRLDLRSIATAPSPEPPDGVVLTSLEARPELVAGVHAVALETFPDIPGGGEPMAAGDLDEFRARDVDRPSIPAGGFAVAVEATTDRVIGYASLLLLPGSTTVAWHDMTAVVRDWRRRGVASALKRATIAWALEHGLETLETGSDDANASMRALNQRLGYVPMPDEVTMRGMPDDAMARG